MIRLDIRARLFAISLSSIAGFVDAVGYMQSGGFFVSFMSGNTTRLGVGLVGRLSEAATAAGIIMCFVLGVVAATLVGRGRAVRKPIILGLVAGALGLAALAASLGGTSLALIFAAFAMGAENATFEEDGEIRFGLTYMTGTLVKLGQKLAHSLAGGPDAAWLPNLQLALALAGGATLGAFAESRLHGHAFWIAAALMAALALVAFARAPRTSPRQ